VKKFFALSLCFGLVCAMSISLVGCDKKDKTAEEKKKIADKKKVDDDAVAAKKTTDDAAAAAKKKITDDAGVKDKDIDKEAAAKKKKIDDDADAAADAKKKKADDDVAASKAKVEIKAHDGVVALKKTDDKKKVTVELADPAPADLTLKAWAKGVKSEVLTGTGTIKKGEKSGDVTIITVDAPDTIIEVTVDASAPDKSKAASTKLKVTVK
jgi:hypothetical protein